MAAVPSAQLADPDPDPWSASQYAFEDDDWDDDISDGFNG
jgi:hypothetical protein